MVLTGFHSSSFLPLLFLPLLFSSLLLRSFLHPYSFPPSSSSFLLNYLAYRKYKVSRATEILQDMILTPLKRPQWQSVRGKKQSAIRTMGTARHRLQTSVFGFVCVHSRGMGEGHGMSQATMIEFATEASGG